MRKIPSLMLSLALGLSFATPAFALDAPAKKPDSKALVDEAVKQHPFFAVLARDKPNFRKNWEMKLTLAQVLLPEFTGVDAAINTGVGLAIDETDAYIAKADDAAANLLVAATAEIMFLGTKEPGICNMMLPGEKSKLSKKEELEFEKKYGPKIMESFLPALSAIFMSNQSGEPRLLPKDDFQNSLLPVALEMVETHGATALVRLTTIDDTKTPAAERCETMGWMMESILKLPEADRAMIGRTMFAAKEG